MKKLSLSLYYQSYFLLNLFMALVFELLIESFGIMGAYLPNFIMCVVFSFAFLKPVPIWLVALGVVIGESFFSTTPALMTVLILIGYKFVTINCKNSNAQQRNFNFIIYMLIGMVIYSTKILWLYATEQRPEVSLMIIKMLVTIILFPIFYLITEKNLRYLNA
ncbi:MAG: hypothetical protein SFT93_03185 [Rickettsiaceae bacterium]|nr:hypothetical protein [Rickettsiaceae bacterium]